MAMRPLLSSRFRMSSVYWSSPAGSQVARLLGRILGPSAKLQSSCSCKECCKAVGSWSYLNGIEACWDFLEAWELHVVLHDCTHGSHHGDTAVLDFSSTEVPEASQVTLLAEASRIKVSQRLRDSDLLGRVKGSIRLSLLTFTSNGFASACSSSCCGSHCLGSGRHTCFCSCSSPS